MTVADELEAFIAEAKRPPPRGAPIARGIHWHFAVCYWANTPERKAALRHRQARKRGGNAHDRRKYRRKMALRDAKYARAAKAVFDPAMFAYPSGPEIIERVPWENP